MDGPAVATSWPIHPSRPALARGRLRMTEKGCGVKQGNNATYFVIASLAFFTTSFGVA